MDKFEELFDEEMVENISNLVEDKMRILREVRKFNEIDQKLSNTMEELDSKLSEDLREKFDDVMRLNYQAEDYYFTLAYLLGMKYGEKTSKI